MHALGSQAISALWMRLHPLTVFRSTLLLQEVQSHAAGDATLSLRALLHCKPALVGLKHLVDLLVEPL